MDKTLSIHGVSHAVAYARGGFGGLNPPLDKMYDKKN
jgi:hypothetical protein